MHNANPNIIVLAGPNGAGKSTIAPALLQNTLHVTEFVNADTIALGLSAFDAEKAAFQAGRIMLRRLRELAEARIDFAFETTLASRSYYPWLKKLCAKGYNFDLIFLWMPNPEFCIKRVKDRVNMGGHDIPAEIIRRRYHTGLRNFFSLYEPLASSWYFYNNAENAEPYLLAEKIKGKLNIHDSETWLQIEDKYHVKKKTSQ